MYELGRTRDRAPADVRAVNPQKPRWASQEGQRLLMSRPPEVHSQHTSTRFIHRQNTNTQTDRTWGSLHTSHTSHSLHFYMYIQTHTRTARFTLLAFHTKCQAVLSTHISATQAIRLLSDKNMLSVTSSLNIVWYMYTYGCARIVGPRARRRGDGRKRNLHVACTFTKPELGYLYRYMNPSQLDVPFCQPAVQSAQQLRDVLALAKTPAVPTYALAEKRAIPAARAQRDR